VQKQQLLKYGPNHHENGGESDS